LDSNVINNHTYRLPTGYTGDSMVFYPTLSGTRVLCPATFRDSVVVYRSPKANFSIDTTRGCQEAAFLLIDQSTAVITKKWDIYRDGTIDGLNVDSVAFLSDTVGHWGVSLWVEHLGGCTDSLLIDSLFEVLKSPKPKVKYASLQSCDTLTLRVRTNNPLDSFVLDYGNGKVDSNKTSKMFYEIPSQWPHDTFAYIITYKVFNPKLSVCQGIRKDTLLLFQGPAIGFMADTLQGCSPLTVTFTDTTQRGLSYAWDFNGDGNTDDTNKVATANLEAGWAPIQLSVTTVEGCTDSISQSRYIRVFRSPEIRIVQLAEKGCANRGIQFLDSSLVDTHVMYRKWGYGFAVHPDLEVVPNPTVSFPGTGTYTVRLMVVDSHACQGIDSVSIDIVNLDTPQANHFQRLWHTGEQQVELQWIAPVQPDFESFTIYRVLNGDSTLIPINTGGYSDVLDDRLDQATYYLQWIDTCGNRSEISEPLYNIVLGGDNLLENVLRLRWTTLGVALFKEYRIYRREPGETAWSLLGSAVAGAKSYIDSAACKASYEYMVEGVTPQGVTSGSHWIRLTGQFKEKALPLALQLATVVNDDSVMVVWERNDHPAHKQYFIDRQDAQGVWHIRIDSTLSNRYMDTAVNVAAEYFRYRVYAQDACGNINPVSNTGSSIRLLGHSKTGRIVLTWNDYQSWPEGYAFLVQARFGAGKFEDMAVLAADSIRYIDNNLHEGADTPWCYRVVALRLGPKADSSVSNTYCDFFSYNFFIPNAFSPNGDGINETYGISGESINRPDLGHIVAFELKIVNRWGQVIFYTTDPRERWDGTHAGLEVSDGIYQYQLYIKTKTGTEHVLSKPIFILR
jgi:gliding motility-associated-like protein